MKRTLQELEAACEHRICVALNRLIQAKTTQEKIQAIRWVKAWEARRFHMLQHDVMALASEQRGDARAGRGARAQGPLATGALGAHFAKTTQLRH